MRIIRGDNEIIPFQRKTESDELIMEIPDKMYLTIKRNEYEKQALIQKTLENGITFEDGTYNVEFLPEDTDNLSFGIYLYDIEIIKDGKKKTIKKGEFVIDSEITHKENEV
jgi:hypothetical protein